jgi:Kelch motif/Galactose oxidase, central domain
MNATRSLSALALIACLGCTGSPGSSQTSREQPAEASGSSLWRRLTRRLAVSATPASQRAAPALAPLGAGLLRQGQCYLQTFPLGQPAATSVLAVPDLGGNLQADAEKLDLASSTWTSTAPMQLVRSAFAAAQLADGRVLVTGGNDNSYVSTTSTELFDGSSGQWLPGPANLSDGRYSHVAVTLNDGRVLIASGVSSPSGAAALTSELFDPTTSTWATAGAVLAGRQEARAVLLADGRVLLAGGYDLSYTPIASAELFDPSTGTWSAAAPMLSARADLALTRLADGRVLATGGYDPTGSPSNTGEVFDPAAGTWTALATPLSAARAFHQAVAVDASHVLLVGGLGGADVSYEAQASSELVDLGTLSSAPTGALVIPRQAAGVLALGDGSVLAVGGCGRSYTATVSSERWSPVSGQWSVLGGLPRARNQGILAPAGRDTLLIAGGQYLGYPVSYPADSQLLNTITGAARSVQDMLQPRTGAQSVALADGRVLAFAGLDHQNVRLTSSELFDPRTGAWAAAGPLLAQHGSGGAAVLLRDGRVLLTGGIDPASGTFLAAAELFDPATGSWTQASPMLSARSAHQTVVLADGRVLAIGGYLGTALLASTELYDPALNQWSAGPALTVARRAASAALLADGSVLVAGGVGAAARLSSETLDPAQQAWSAAGRLGYGRQQATLLRDQGGRLLLAGGGALPLESFDGATRTWQYLGPQLSISTLASGTLPLLTDRGTALLLPNVYSDDVVQGLVLSTFKPVAISVRYAVGGYSVSVGGNGTYDPASATFSPPLAGSGQSTLTAIDSTGARGGVQIGYSAAPITPVALTSTSATNFGSVRVPAAGAPKVSKRLTLAINFAGTRHAAQVTASGLSADFAFAGGSYPGTGGTCTTEITAACTLVLAFTPSTAAAQGTPLTLSYLDGSRPRSVTFTLQGTGEQLDPAQRVLVIYNAASPDSVALKDYYLAHRPGFAAANTLALTTTTGEVVAQADYLAQIETPFVQYLQANPQLGIRYVVWMYGLPTRTSGGAYQSTSYLLSRALQSRGLASGAAYGPSVPADEFNRDTYPGTTALVTALNMGSVAATTAYIDKVAAMYAAMPIPDLVVSASAAGLGGTNYLFEDAQGYAGFGLGQVFQTGMLALNPTANSVYVPQTSPIINSATDLSGYFSWGVHAGLPATYAVDGTVTFNGRSSWFLIATAESFNGQQGCSQGCYPRWFAANAFGGSAYGQTPAGAATHVEEPYTSGINSGAYFAMWEAGYLFAEAAWNSRNTDKYLALGDPLITR